MYIHILWNQDHLKMPRLGLKMTVQKENGMLSFHGFLGVVCYVRSLKHIKYLHLQLRLKKAVS
jgi:hypothetical protein